MSLQPNQYTTEFVLGTAAAPIDFGFVSSYIRVTNLGGVPLRVNVASSASSTDGLHVPPLATREWPSRAQKINIATSSTTTSTGTGTSATRSVRLQAWE